MEGILNVRYLLVNVTHGGYAGLINKFTALHAAKEDGNMLTVRPNIANTLAIVKVVAQPGWVQSEGAYLLAQRASGLIVEIHPFTALNKVLAYLSSSEWPQPEVLL